MLGVLATVLWAGTATAPPSVAACPSEGAVAAELDRLGASAALAALGSPEVTVEGTKMRVVLRGLDGSVMGAREVVAPEACRERASVAAVFIAAWVGAWSTKPLPNPPSTSTAAPSANVAKTARPEDSRIRVHAPGSADVAARAKPPSVVVGSSSGQTPAQPSAASPASPRATTTPPPAPASTPATAPALPPAPSSPPSSTSPPEAISPARPKPAPAVEVAGLAFATHDGDAGTFGAGVFATYRLAEALSVAALLETTGEREAALQPGVAGYRTSRFGLGASVPRRWGRLRGEVGIFPELTMLTATGRQLAVNRSITTWGAAVDLRGRLGLAVGRFVPFLFAGGNGALRAERLTLDNRPQTTTLSRWNLSAGAGLAIVLGKNE